MTVHFVDSSTGELIEPDVAPVELAPVERAGITPAGIVAIVALTLFVVPILGMAAIVGGVVAASIALNVAPFAIVAGVIVAIVLIARAPIK